MVGLLVGGNGVAVLVGVGVLVTVGVGVGPLSGEFSPNSQKINAAAPATSKIAAPIITAIGVPCRICWRLRCASITFWGDSFSLMRFSSYIPKTGEPVSYSSKNIDA
jgi:hypothetical protein